MKKIFWSSLEVLQTVIIAVVAVFLVRTFIAQPFLVSGQSMEPTFHDGNYLLVDEVAYRLRNPERGEVVVFRYPGDHRSFYIKRIIGLPGERIVVSAGMVTVYPITDSSGETLREPYIMPGGAGVAGGTYETVLGSDTYFVMGDNRNFSYDSRSWGPLKRSEIIGLVRIRLWPVTEVMAFSAPTYP
ncbi:MAG: signal peptidase I [bacterium]|nr:signal peptidase I [bacterium]